MTSSSLSALGLDPLEESIYRSLIARPTADAVVLAEELGLPQTEVVRRLADLQRNGLAMQSATDSDSFVAVEPGLALRSLVVAHAAALQSAQAEVEALSRVFRSASAARSATDVVDVVSGRDAVERGALHFFASAEDQLRCLIRLPRATSSDANDRAEAEAMRRGIRYRLVADTGVMQEPGAVERAKDTVRRGVQVRVASSVPIKLLVLDDRLALLPLAAQPGDQVIGALLVHPSGLLDAVIGLFELLWRTCPDLRGGCRNGGTAADRA